jgi:hypothetical protein
MVYWRFKNRGPYPWCFGYVAFTGETIRMGRWNGDTTGGTVVSANEIEWRPYR